MRRLNKSFRMKQKNNYCMLHYFFMRALIIGRFQPFHNGHAMVVQEAKKYELIFAIGSAYESFTFENPFTAGERYEMIFSALKEKKIERFHIIPVPDINRYGVYVQHVEDIVPSFDVVISNNLLIQQLFEREGYKVVETSLFEREKYQGKVIRQRIAEGKEWESLVPISVAEFIKGIKGDERIRNLAKQDCKGRKI